MHSKREIRHIHLAVCSSCTQYLLLSLCFCFSTGAHECVRACVLQEGTSAFIFKHPQGVLVDIPACDIPHARVCVCVRARLVPAPIGSPGRPYAGTAISPQRKEAGGVVG